MTPRAFFDKVALMRKLQRDYFRHRLQSTLRQCRAIEAEIDKEIERVNAIVGPSKPTEQQQTLFPNSDTEQCDRRNENPNLAGISDYTR